ncbi:hypothetical protein ACFQYP_35690 [Nonomuraea antimicrobica]
MQLPTGLRKFMDMSGRHWPMSDEEKLLKIGLAWLGMSGDMGRLTGDAATFAAGTWAAQEETASPPPATSGRPPTPRTRTWSTA